jgi:hypothetical protein
MCWTYNHQNIYRNGPKAHFPFKCAYKFWMLVEDLHFDFLYKEGQIIHNPIFDTYKLNGTNWRIEGYQL